MACAKCQAHRDRIKTAAKSGSITKTTQATTDAMREFNRKMMAKFTRPHRDTKK